MPVDLVGQVLVHLLEIIEGPERGLRQVWEGARLIVGREQDCHLSLSDAAVSRHHCVFLKDEYTTRIRDLGSRNGTLINGQRVQGEVLLQSGDVVVVGQTKLRYLAVSDRQDARSQPTATAIQTRTATMGQILM